MAYSGQFRISTLMASNNLLEASHFLQNHKSANPNFVQTRYIYDT